MSEQLFPRPYHSFFYNPYQRRHWQPRSHLATGRCGSGTVILPTMASAAAATSASGSQAARPSRISSARPVVNEAWRLLRFRARLILRLDGEHPYRGLGHHNRQDGGFVEVLHVGGWQRNNGARGFDLHRRSTDFLDSTRGDAHVRQDWLTRLPRKASRNLPPVALPAALS